MDHYCTICGRNQKSKTKYCNQCGAKMSPGITRQVELLDNRYRVERILKSGNMGCVYRAVDTRLGETVAVKKMQATYNFDTDGNKFQEMFLREAKLLAKLHHGGLPKVTDFFTKEDPVGRTSHYLVMTFIEGVDLECYLRKNIPPLPLDEVIGFFRQILDIFSYLHSQNPPVVYRDLKPSNIMFNNGRLLLVDFGIAKILKPLQKGTMWGTRGYASPDQCRGNDSPQNDIYSLGVLIHYLLSGLNPEDSSRPLFTFEPVRNSNKDIPEFLDNLILSMVEMSNVNRPGSIDQIIKILDGSEGRHSASSLVSKPPVINTPSHLTSDRQSPANATKPALSSSYDPAPSGPSYFPKNQLIKRQFDRYDDFFKAVKNDRIMTVEEYINQGADVNAKDSKNVTPLQYATFNGHTNIVRLLISEGAYVNTKDNNGRTLLHRAAKEGHTDIVKLLTSKNALVNAKENSGWTPLHYAARYGHADIVKLLVSKSANVNTKENSNWTPLHYAARYGHIEVVKSLISRGANVNARENSNWTPLHLAESKGHSDIVELLISRGANINAKDNDGWTPLHFASNQGNTEIVRFLMSNGADINVKDNKGWTLLHYAVRYGHIDVVRLLISKGVNVNAKENRGWTPLHYAARYGHIDVIKLLISRGANVNAKENNGWVSLHLAESKEHTDIIELLISRGANVNAKDNDGWTPLHGAASDGHKDTAKLLVSKGANVNAEDVRGWTPRQYATSNGHTHIASFLHKNGVKRLVSEKKFQPSPGSLN
ncbi:MAG: ankyrin repeat domain-containing protein [Candidatus Eremiobacteraeota bacterium]|nr:ankyrin repeat domain-containing protein [Candidatus Eremiobacteraeota bacterium]